ILSYFLSRQRHVVVTSSIRSFDDYRPVNSHWVAKMQPGDRLVHRVVRSGSVAIAAHIKNFLFYVSIILSMV
ncbi:MAG: hypothetical protein ACRC5D_01690, partial [Aeromonas allosaccharophila]